MARELDLGTIELTLTCAGTVGDGSVTVLDFETLGIFGYFFAGPFGAGSSGSTTS